MVAQYSIGDTLITKDGKEHIVKTFVKDFQKKCINYRTEAGLLIPETDVEECIPCGLVPLADRTPLQAVAPKQTPEEIAQEITNKKIASIDKLTQEQLVKFIADSKLEIDAEDYATREELASAICEELGLI